MPGDHGAGLPILLHIESREPRPMCGECGAAAEIKDRPHEELADLPAFGRPVPTVWRKHRWRCPDPESYYDGNSDRDPNNVRLGGALVVRGCHGSVDGARQTALRAWRWR